MAETLDYLIRLRGAREAAADADIVAASQNRIASSSRKVKEESGIAASAFGRSMEGMKEAAHGVAGLALGGIGLFAGFEGLKGAVEDTQRLAISASSLSRVTGMNINTAAQWLAVAQAHGIATRTLTMSFRTLTTQAEGAITGTKKSQIAFKALGISTDELKSKSHSMNELMGLVADRFNKMPGGIQKTAIAAQLFGRGWQQLIPLLSTGSKGMEDLRKTAAAYGVTLGKDPLENAHKLHEAEIKLQLAQTGMQIFMAEKLAPAFILITTKALALYRAIQHDLGPAFPWLTRLAGALLAAFVVTKIVGFAKAITGLGRDIGGVARGIIGLIGRLSGRGGMVDELGNAGSAAGGLAGKLTGRGGLAADVGATASEVGALAGNSSAAAGGFGAMARNAGSLIARLAGPAGLAFALTMVGQKLQDVLLGGNAPPPGGGIQGPQLPNQPGAQGANIFGVHVGGPGGAALHALGIGARGAVVRRPTLAVIGERGPEQVTPLDQMPGNSPIGRASDGGGGDIVFKIGEHEFARIARRTMMNAMAANA